MNFSRKTIENYLLAHGWEIQELNWRSTMELLELIENPQYIEDWKKEKNESR